MTVMTELTYVGRRTLGGGKLGHGFAPVDRPDRQSFFALKRGSYVVGGIYEGLAETSEIGELTALTASSLTYTRRQIEDEDLRAAWELADRQAYRTEATRLAADRAKRSPAYADALAPMVRIMATAKSYAEAARIADAIRAELLEAWK